MTPSRTVLMVAYAFPPEAYVGGRRTLKYCKYLGEFGWQPIVVTIKPRDTAFQDERLCRQLPANVVVLRTRDLDAAEWVGSLASLWHRVRGRGPSAAAAPVAAQGQPGAVPVRASRLSRLKEFVLRALLDSPDSHVFWTPLAFLRGARVLMTRKVDVVYSSSPPHSSHLAAFLLARIFRKPHVVDFRDPWLVAGPTPVGGTPAPLIDRVQAAIKRIIVNNAAKVIVVSPGEPDEICAEYPQLDARRVAVLTNGYDPEDFVADPEAVVDRPHCTITHAGTIYRETGSDFFEAIEQLVANDPGLRQLLRINLIGEIDPAHLGVIGRLEAAGVVRTFGLLPHQATLAWAQKSDVLLILQRGGTSAASHIPAKVFEYLFIGKPILAIGAPGSLSDLLQASGLGVIVPPRDTDRLAEAIRMLCGDVGTSRVRVRPNPAYIRGFERRNLTAQLTGLLNEVASAARGSQFKGEARWMRLRS